MDKSIYYPYENNVLDVEDIHQIKQVLFGHKQSDIFISSITGSATGGSDTTLIDTGATFVSDSVVLGDAVYNSSDDSYAIVKTVDSETQLTITKLVGGTLNTFSAGNNYQVKVIADQIMLVTQDNGSWKNGLYKRKSDNSAWEILGGNVTTPQPFGTSINNVPLYASVNGKELKSSHLSVFSNFLSLRTSHVSFQNTYVEYLDGEINIYCDGSQISSYDTSGFQIGNTGARVTEILESADATTPNDTTLPTTKWVDDRLGGGASLYDITVASSGGDYTNLRDALVNATAGQTIFVKSGTYTETVTEVTPKNGVSIIGENKENTIIENITIGYHSTTKTSAGTLSISGTTVTGVGTSFTSAVAGDYLYIPSKGLCLKIDSITDATHLELEFTYTGGTVLGESFFIYDFTTGNSFSNLTFQGTSNFIIEGANRIELSNNIFKGDSTLNLLEFTKNTADFVFRNNKITGYDNVVYYGGTDYKYINILIDENYLQSAGGIYMVRQGFTVSNNELYSSAGIGIMATSAGGGDTGNIRIIDNHLKNCAGGITNYDFSNVTIKGNHVENTSTYGIYASVDASNTIINDNIVTGSGNHGMYILGKFITINGNEVSGGSTRGIFMSNLGSDEAENFIVTNNNVHNNSHAGIMVDDNLGIGVISNNIVRSNSDGIEINDDCSDIVITGNLCMNNSGSGLRISTGCVEMTASANLLQNNGTNFSNSGGGSVIINGDNLYT